MEMINDYLSDFKIILPIQGYELETSKKVNLEKLRKITWILNELNKFLWIYNFQPYLKDLMYQVYNFYFGNATTDFEKADKVVVLLSDLLGVYSIEKWLTKHVAISQKSTFYHRYFKFTPCKIIWRNFSLNIVEYKISFFIPIRFSVDSLLNAAKNVDFPGAGHDDEACYLFR